MQKTSSSTVLPITIIAVKPHRENSLEILILRPKSTWRLATERREREKGPKEEEEEKNLILCTFFMKRVCSSDIDLSECLRKNLTFLSSYITNTFVLQHDFEFLNNA